MDNCALHLQDRHSQEDSPDKHKKRSSRFPSSASAHDLRCADMEKERLDGSSPKGVIDGCFKGSDSTDSPHIRTPESVHHSSSTALSNWSKFFKLWKRKSIKRLASFPSLGMTRMARRKSRSTRERDVAADLNNIYCFKSSLENFTIAQLEAATNHFSQENIIGKGGFAEVYKGCLPDGKLIAVKRLTTGTSDEKIAGFLSELGILAHIDHPNVAKLLGCGVDGGMHLVFELSRFGNLASVLYSLEFKPDWAKRYKIALGTADALHYLHDTCTKRIIHRDIKPQNILLTEDYEPQLCDFGLAKWLPSQWTHHNVSKFEGTLGYLAPEYFMHGIVDEKTDVYAFGVLLLELITGHKALDDLQQNIVLWAKPLLDNNDIKELIDSHLGDNYDIEEMDSIILTASLCIEQSPILRPKMSQVVTLLRGDEYVAECAKQCKRGSHQRTYSEELWDVQEYNSTRHLKDLRRYKQIVMDSLKQEVNSNA